MVSIKTVLVRKALVVLDYFYYHCTHRKIPFLMILISEACKAICPLHDCLKSEFSVLCHDFDCTWAQKHHNFAALCYMIFSKLHRVPHMILHLAVYILLRNSKMADRNMQRAEVFLKNQYISFIGLYRPTSKYQGKSFYMYL